LEQNSPAHTPTASTWFHAYQWTISVINMYVAKKVLCEDAKTFIQNTKAVKTGTMKNVILYTDQL